MRIGLSTLVWAGAAVVGAVFVAPTLYAYPDSVQTCRDAGGKVVMISVDDGDFGPFNLLATDDDLDTVELDRSAHTGRLVIVDDDFDPDFGLSMAAFKAALVSGIMGPDDFDFASCEISTSGLTRAVGDLGALQIADDDFDLVGVSLRDRTTGLVLSIDDESDDFDPVAMTILDDAAARVARNAEATVGTLTEVTALLTGQRDHLDAMLAAPGGPGGDSRLPEMSAALDAVDEQLEQAEDLNELAGAVLAESKAVQQAVAQLKAHVAQLSAAATQLQTDAQGTRDRIAALGDVDLDGIDDLADTCPMLPNPTQQAWTPGRYKGGAVVVSGGDAYVCRPNPFSGWCGLSAYEPGRSRYWQRAWEHMGRCHPSPPPSSAAGGTAGGCDLLGWASGTYAPGDRVQHEGVAYACKPFPYTGWCGQRGYEPGVSPHWAQAWTEVGPCR